MNFFGIATGTDTYALSVSERSELRPGDIVTVVFLHDNTGASTLNVNGFGPVPLLRNASAMSAGDLVASTTYQFCYTGASFVQDVQASAGATTDASLLTSGTLAAARLPSNINAANLADGSVSNTELQYINSVTSNVQSQLDAVVASVVSEAATRAADDSGLASSLAGKANTSHTHSGADITTGTVPVAAIPTAIPAASIANGTVDNTEFQTLNGVTSNIQNQLDNKQPSATGTPDGTKFLGDDNSWKNVSATDSSKMPLTGGTFSGDLSFSNTGSLTGIYRTTDSQQFALSGGSGWAASAGAWLVAYGTSHAAKPGILELRAGNATGGSVKIYDKAGTLRLNVNENGLNLAPSDMPYSAAGATFTNDGNWYNLYSLAQGTHNGEFKIACALFGGLVTFSIDGTSISLLSDGWGGSFADVTAASGKIAFRVSGGYLQINVGTGISSTPKKFLAIFFGTVN